MDETNVFDALAPTAEPAEVGVAAAPDATKDKKKKLAEMKKALIEVAQTDSTFNERLRTLSNSLEVVNSLGFGEKGNIVVDTTKSTDDKRALTPTSTIMGYRIRNIGSQPIPYQTEIWQKNPETGKYEGSLVDQMLAPGATADLSREYMTRFCAQPEISFQLANGKVVRGSGGKGGKTGLKEELEAYYFTFAKGGDGPHKQVNSDEVKLNIGERGEDGKWHVKPEFIETFGYLENIKEGGRTSKRGSSKPYTASDLAANYVMQMIKGHTM